MSGDYIARAIARAQQREFEFAVEHGIKPYGMGCGILGSVAFTATEAEKLLKKLRKLKRLENKRTT